MKQKRREFMEKTAVWGAGSLLSASFPYVDAGIKAQNGFDILFFATRWGWKGSLEEYCQAVKKEGYDGVEEWLPGDERQADELMEMLQKYELSFGALIGSSGSNPEEHIRSYEANIDRVMRLKPVYVNSHAGKDYFQLSDKKRLIEIAIAKTSEYGIPVYHETHRGKILFAAHECAELIRQFPELGLTLDISHWCNVAESLLQDQAEAVGLALGRTGHIHSRIGHEEGPQVSDPRAPEWKNACDAHFNWWDQVVTRKKKQGTRLTVLTEFGPPNYLWTQPFSREPLADQWQINVHMMDLFRKRYL